MADWRLWKGTLSLRTSGANTIQKPTEHNIRTYSSFGPKEGEGRGAVTNRNIDSAEQWVAIGGINSSRSNSDYFSDDPVFVRRVWRSC